MLAGGHAGAQTACNPNIAIRLLGSSSNIQTILQNRLQPLAYDSSSHSLVFIHRNDVALFDGTSGQLRYDVSPDSGASWTNNEGLLNPITYATNPGRFPEAVIYNPGGSSDYKDDYLAYYAATTNGFVYNGYASGSRQLDGAPNTEFVNQAGISQNTYIPGGLCQGAPGVFWTADAIYNYTTSTYSGFRIFKGVWNGTDVVWSLNKELLPDFDLSYNGKPQVADWNLAFDPSGMHGWLCVLTHLNGSAGYLQYRPVFYNTDDGGATWNGPAALELNSFPEIISIVEPGKFPATAYQVDISVDMNGHPHAFLNVCSGSGIDYTINSTSAYLFDISYDGLTWMAKNVAKVDGFRGYLGLTDGVWHDNEPQLTRSHDGKIMAFLWTDSQGGGGQNDVPNLYGIYYDVPNNAWSAISEYTSCTAYNGKILWPRISSELITTGINKYKIPVVFGELNASGSENDPATFHFIDNLTFSECDILGGPNASITVNGNSVICEGDSVLLQANFDISYSYQWQLNGEDIEGATTHSIWVDTSGNYSVKINNGSICEGVDQVTITVNPYPVAVIQSDGTTTICHNDSVNLFTNTIGAYTYQWLKNNFPIPGATASNFFASPPGVFTLQITVEGGCSSKSNAIIVNALPFTNPVISGLAPDYCISNSDVELTGIPAGGVFSGGNFSGNIFSPSLTGAGSFTISYTWIDLQGCKNIADSITTIHDLPATSFSGLNESLCINDTLQLLTGFPLGGTFTGPAIVQNYFDPSVAPIGLNVITYSFTDSLGCANSFSDSTTVYELPVVVASSDTVVCSESPVQLSATGANVYQWSPPQGLNDPTSDSPVAMPESTIVYTVSGFSAEGCRNKDSVTITALSLPAVQLGNDTALCEGDSVLLETIFGNDDVYQWYLDGNEISGATNNFYTAHATGVYSLKATNGNGCVAMDELMLKINPLPIVTIQSAGTTTICEGDSTDLFTSDTGFVSYQWRKNGSSITGATSTFYSASPTANYALQVSDSNACTAISNGIAVNAPLQIIPAITGLAPDYCINSADAELQGIPSGGVFSGGVFNGSSFSPSATGAGNFTITYTITDTFGCKYETNEPAAIHELPVVSFSAMSDAYCANDVPVALSGDPAGGIFTGTGVNGNFFDPTQALIGENIITYSFSDSFSCSNTATDTITINELPVIFLSNDTAICSGSSAQLHAAGADTYEWLPATGLDDASSNHPVATPVSTITYTVTGYSSLGCSNNSQLTITVNPLPFVNLGADTILCDSASLMLDAGDGYSFYNWSTGAVTQTIEVTDSNAYSVVVTDANGCQGSDTIAVDVDVCTAVEEVIGTSNRLEVYPNPATGFVTIEYHIQDRQPVTLMISDLPGRIIFEKHGLSDSGAVITDVSATVPGMYFIRLITSLGVRAVEQLDILH